MNNLKFYERSIALRNKYSNEEDDEKFLVLQQLVDIAFKSNDALPVNFNILFPGYLLSQNTSWLRTKVFDVVHDLGYKNCEVSDSYFYNTYTCFSIYIKL